MAPKGDISQPPVTQSLQGAGNTEPFDLVAGDYRATVVFTSDCAYYLDLKPTPDNRRSHDVGDSSEAHEHVNYLYGVEGGRYYIRGNTGPAPDCPWTATLERLP